MNKAGTVIGRMRGLLAAGVLATAAGLAAGPSASAQDGGAPLFAKINGTWSGTGTISLSDGAKERVRCRVEYQAGKDGRRLDQSMRCTSDNYDFNVDAKVDYAEGGITGSWLAPKYEMNGNVTGRVDASRIVARIAGSGLAINLLIATNGSSQDIVLTSENTKIAGINVKLAKGK